MGFLMKGCLITVGLTMCAFLICKADTNITDNPIVANLYEDTHEKTEIVCLTCVIVEGAVAPTAAPVTPTTTGTTAAPTSTVTTTVGVTTAAMKHNGLYEISDVAISPAGHCRRCFDVYKLKDSKNYCLYYLPSQGSLSYEIVPQYNIAVACTDNLGHSSTEIVEVRLTTNEPPKIETPDKTGPCTLDANDDIAKINDVLKDRIKVVDPNDDPLYYTMTMNPPSSKFKIGPNDGIIRATADLSHHCDPNHSVKFSVNVTDKTNTPVGPIEITCEIINAKEPVTISNANRIVTLGELSPVATEIKELKFTPQASTLLPPDVFFDITTYPPDAYSYLKIDDIKTQSQLIKLAKTLNYENTRFRNFNMSITPRNNYCTSKTYWIYVKVEDENDPPILGPKIVLDTIDEGDIKLNFYDYFSNEDEDQFSGGDRWEYSIVGDAKGFKIDRNTGEITPVGGDYDVDKSGKQPQDVSLKIMVQDSKGGMAKRLNDTVELKLHIRDVNDNPPYFKGTTSYSKTVSECGALGGTIGRAISKPVDDEDVGERESNKVHCVPVNNGEIAVNADCKVYYVGYIPGGTTSTIEVFGTDRGTHPKALKSRNSVTITVTSTVCTTTTYVPGTTIVYQAPQRVYTTTTTTILVTIPAPPATTTVPVPASSTSSLAWIIPAAILGALALAGISYLMWRYCSCDSPPRPPTPRHVRPATPPSPDPPKRVKTPDPPEPPPVEEAEVAWVYSGTSVLYERSTQVATQPILVQNVQPVTTYEVPMQMMATQPYVTY